MKEINLFLLLTYFKPISYLQYARIKKNKTKTFLGALC